MNRAFQPLTTCLPKLPDLRCLGRLFPTAEFARFRTSARCSRQRLDPAPNPRNGAAYGAMLSRLIHSRVRLRFSQTKPLAHDVL